MTVIVCILFAILAASAFAIVVGFNNYYDNTTFNVGIVGAMVSIIALVLIGVTASANYENEQRELCESKGGTYITGKYVDPVCMKSDQTINLGE